MLEREHKFLVAAFPDPAQLRAAYRDAGFELRPGRVRRHHDVYYDTPARTLLGSGVALRIRRIGTEVLATYKGRSEIKGSLHAREEIEVPYRAPWPAEILRVLPPGALSALAPLLALTTQRTRYLLSPSLSSSPTSSPGTSPSTSPAAELTFDEVSAGFADRRCHFRELELEAHPGTPDAVLAALAAPLGHLGLSPHTGDKLTHALSLLGLLEAAPLEMGLPEA